MGATAALKFGSRSIQKVRPPIRLLLKTFPPLFFYTVTVRRLTQVRACSHRGSYQRTSAPATSQCKANLTRRRLAAASPPPRSQIGMFAALEPQHAFKGTTCFRAHAPKERARTVPVTALPFLAGAGVLPKKCFVTRKESSSVCNGSHKQREQCIRYVTVVTNKMNCFVTRK